MFKVCNRKKIFLQITNNPIQKNGQGFWKDNPQDKERNAKVQQTWVKIFYLNHNRENTNIKIWTYLSHQMDNNLSLDIEKEIFLHTGLNDSICQAIQCLFFSCA